MDSSYGIHFIFPVQTQKKARIFLLKILLLLLFFYPFSFALLYIPIQLILLFFCLPILFEQVHPFLHLPQISSARIPPLILACKHICIPHACARNIHVQKLPCYIFSYIYPDVPAHFLNSRHICNLWQTIIFSDIFPVLYSWNVSLPYFYYVLLDSLYPCLYLLSLIKFLFFFYFFQKHFHRIEPSSLFQRICFMNWQWQHQL